MNKPQRPKGVRKKPTRQRRPRNHPLQLIIDSMEAPFISSIIVKSVITELGLNLTEGQLSLITNYLLQVQDFNKTFNLVSRLEVEVVLITSLWESLCFFSEGRITFEPGSKLLDIGTGGGFPGIPLAIAAPELEVTLLDSRRVKIIALQRIVQELGLENTIIIRDRAETLKDHDSTRYDLVTARAVGSLKEVAPWASGLLKAKGKLMIWKGPEGLRELNSLPQNDWVILNKIPVQSHRNLLVLEYQN